MRKVFTKDEMFSIVVEDEKTCANPSDLNDIIGEVMIMKRKHEYIDTDALLSVYNITKAGMLEKWNGIGSAYNCRFKKVYITKLKDKRDYLDLLDLNNDDEFTNFAKAEELIRKIENDPTDFVYDKTIHQGHEDVLEI